MAIATTAGAAQNMPSATSAQTVQIVDIVSSF